jgi:hypothetical protein
MENCFFLLLHGTLKKRKGGGKKEREREKKKSPGADTESALAAWGKLGFYYLSRTCSF